MPQEKPTPPPEAPERLTDVDRLIELAPDKDDKGSTNNKDPQERSMWKLLLQLRPFLPYLTRLVPVLDVVAGPLQNAGMASDVRKAVAQSMAESTAKLESVQRELSTTVSSALERQSSQLERLDQELTRLRQASDKFAAAQASLSKELRSLARLIQIAVIGGFILLVVLIVMSGIALARLPH